MRLVHSLGGALERFFLCKQQIGTSAVSSHSRRGLKSERKTCKGSSSGLLSHLRWSCLLPSKNSLPHSLPARAERQVTRHGRSYQGSGSLPLRSARPLSKGSLSPRVPKELGLSAALSSVAPAGVGQVVCQHRGLGQPSSNSPKSLTSRSDSKKLLLGRHVLPGSLFRQPVDHGITVQVRTGEELAVAPALSANMGLMRDPTLLGEGMGHRTWNLEHIYAKVLVRCSSGLAVFLHLLHMRKHRYLPHESHFGAQNGRSGLPGCCWTARKGHSGLLRRRRCVQSGRSDLPRCRQCARKGCSGPLQRCQCAQNSCSGPLWYPYAPKIAVLACSGAASAL